MAILTQITGSRIFGSRHPSHTFQPITLVEGPNESGKTTALLLPLLLVNGPAGSRWPLLGESPTYHWSVRGVWEGEGRRFEVARGMDEDGHFLIVNGSPQPVKKGQERIERMLGYPLAFSVEAFLTATPENRLGFLQSGKLGKLELMESGLLQGSDWTVSRVLESIAAEGLEWEKLVEWVQPGKEDKLPPVTWPSQYNPSGSANLDTLIALLSEVHRKVDATARASLAVSKGTGKVETLRPLPRGTAAEWKTRTEELDRAIGDLRERKGRVVADAETRTRYEADMEKATARLQELRGRNYDEALEKADQEIQALVEESKRMAAAVAEKEAAKSAAETLWKRRLAESSAAEKEAAEYDGLVRSQGTLERYRRFEVEPRMVFVGDVLGSIVHRFDGALAEDVEKAQARVAELRFTGADAAQAMTARLLELRQAAEGAATLQAAAQRGFTSATSALTEANRQAVETERKLGEARQARAALVSERDNLAEILRGLTDRVDEIRLALVELGTATTGDLDKQLAQLQAERKTADDNRQDLAAADQAEANRLENESLRERAVSRRTELGKALDALARIRGTILAESLARLEEPISRITRHVLQADFRGRIENGGFTFDLVRDGASLGHGSRSVRAVAYLALRAAVIQSMRGWRFLLLDDMENIGHERQIKFFEALAVEVEAGRIHQVLAARVANGGEPAIPGVHTLRLGF